jgi:hypothetical protein
MERRSVVAWKVVHGQYAIKIFFSGGQLKPEKSHIEAFMLLNLLLSIPKLLLFVFNVQQPMHSTT